MKYHMKYVDIYIILYYVTRMPKISGLFSRETNPSPSRDGMDGIQYPNVGKPILCSQKLTLNLGSLSFEERPFSDRCLRSLEFQGDVRL